MWDISVLRVNSLFLLLEVYLINTYLQALLTWVCKTARGSMAQQSSATNYILQNLQLPVSQITRNLPAVTFTAFKIFLLDNVEMHCVLQIFKTWGRVTSSAGKAYKLTAHKLHSRIWIMFHYKVGSCVAFFLNLHYFIET